jgi:hypothetical protein
MSRPTEEEKKANNTSEVVKGKMNVRGQEIDVDITVETKPNAGGGYDTKLKLPISPIGSKAN